ncbi:MAG: amidase [Saprospiraceae bacterium]|nr:amidase [Saprospiraceae bacterium]MDW8484783.1 amidase [Saprospiraceae bacterium]
MTFEEYRQYDALGLAALVRRGEVSPVELIDIAAARIAEVNPRLNAVIHLRVEEARNEAQQVNRDALFAGVPFLVKDLGMEVEGMPMCLGSRAYKSYRSTRDSEVIKRAKRAGLLILGKTNTPEFGLTPFTEPRAFGPTRNPWNEQYSPGGSSGGSAAAVAAGIAPIATANDGGGSIRIPASCCGLFGLKPTRGRVSWAPLLGEMWSGAAIEHCVSRTVRDSAAYLDVIQGAVPGDPYVIEPPARPYLQEVETPPGRLRIGYSLEHTMGFSIDKACEEAVLRVVDILRAEGHEVAEVPLPYLREDLANAFLAVVAGELGGDIYTLQQFLGRPVRPSDVEPSTYALYLLSQSFSAIEYVYAKRQWSIISQRIAGFYEKYDLLLTPTLARRPVPIGSLQPQGAEERLMRVVNTLRLGTAVKASIQKLADKIYDYMPWTPFANITGQPSMSIPALRTPEENLPIGVMFTARWGEEHVLFRLAGQLEKAIQWDKDKPLA